MKGDSWLVSHSFTRIFRNFFLRDKLQQGLGLQLASIASQIDLNKSQAEKNEAEANKIAGVDTDVQKATIDNLIAQTSNEKVKKGLILGQIRVADAEKQNTYTYSSASKDGVVEFDGAMTSKVVPQTITVNDTADTVNYSLGDKLYKLAITWDGDNISAVTREDVT